MTIERLTQNAVTAHKEGGKEVRKTLETIFGKETFYTKITDRVKSWEDVCEIKGLDPVRSLPYPLEPIDNRSDEAAVNALFVLSKAREVLNEEWVPDWKNSNQKKWFPYFEYCSSGFGFSTAYYLYVCALTGVGSRLCFKSADLARHAATHFLKYYNALYVL